MPMTDVVAQPGSARPHWAALRNKKIRSKLLRHDRLKPSRLAGWSTTGGWADRTGQDKKYTSGPRPHSPCLCCPSPLCGLPVWVEGDGQ